MVKSTVFSVNMRIIWSVCCALALCSSLAFSQASVAQAQAQPEKKWFEKINLRGYTQVRYNRLLETNSQLKCEQCDRSIGDGGGFFIRRARLIFSGQVSDNVFIYIQPDFATTSGDLHFAQLRDAYFDYSLDSLRQFRFRFGQSKIPFGYENMQSSQNRLTVDRADALNSAVPNERDLGVFFYWAPDHVRKLYSDLVNKGLKGSGDYGSFGIGVYNGQTMNKAEANNASHFVIRGSYPIEVGGQVIEPGIQAYHGRIAPLSTTAGVQKAADYLDERVAASIAIAPKPIGFIAEFNWGHGPRYMAAKDTTEKNRVVGSTVEGGFALLYFKIDEWSQHFLPFVRAQYYRGGKKQELDTRYYDMQELEMGLEWQPHSSVEFTAAYAMSKRNTSDAAKPINNQSGNFLRLQAQFNY